MEITNEEDIKRLITADERMMGILCAAASLNLPDWMIGAGFVRNRIWDELHGYGERTVSESIDIDLIYYDKEDIDEAREKESERRLNLILCEKWSVKNQARISTAYLSSEDAISQWPETCTCVAVRLDKEGRLELIAPAGIDDLINLVVRRGSRFDDEARYRRRIEEKEWLKKWPRLRVANN